MSTKSNREPSSVSTYEIRGGKLVISNGFGASASNTRFGTDYPYSTPSAVGRAIRMRGSLLYEVDTGDRTSLVKDMANFAFQGYGVDKVIAVRCRDDSADKDSVRKVISEIDRPIDAKNKLVIIDGLEDLIGYGEKKPNNVQKYVLDSIKHCVRSKGSERSVPVAAITAKNLDDFHHPSRIELIEGLQVVEYVPSVSLDLGQTGNGNSPKTTPGLTAQA